MAIKIRFHTDNKAIIRWKNPAEREFLKSQMTMFRDSVKKIARISVKDEKGRETPKIQPITTTAPVPQVIEEKRTVPNPLTEKSEVIILSKEEQKTEATHE